MTHEHEDDLAECDIEIAAWTQERYDAVKRGDAAKVTECEHKIAALVFYRERITP